MALTEDLAAYFLDFGTDVTVGAGSVRGIFDKEYRDAFGLIDGTRPVVMCRTADLGAVSVGTAVTINSTSYSVVSLRPDGTGMTMVELKA